jgi:hypothetical protein
LRRTVDVFPAIIRLAPTGSVDDQGSFSVTGDAPAGTRRLDRCRVVIVNDVMMVVVDSPEGPSLVFREAVEGVSTSGGITRATTRSGKVVAFTKDHNCGCGSRLRSWDPYGAVVNSSEDPA